MRTTDELEFNEILILARQGGQISLWGCWKRQLAMFHDPALWKSVESFDQHFERLAGPHWNPSPYGFVVVDFDTRQVLSANDWSTPASIYPIMDNVVFEDQADPSLTALQALSLRSDYWPHVQLLVAKKGLRDLLRKTQDPNIEEITMDQALGSDSTADDFMAAMTVRRGFANIPTLGKCMILEGRFLPPGWRQHDDRGKDEFWLLDQLEDLRARGFPAPAWDYFDSAFESIEIPVRLEALTDMRKEADAGDSEARELLAAGLRYRALKENWKSTFDEAGPGKAPIFTQYRSPCT